jgi:hypothetical protein
VNDAQREAWRKAIAEHHRQQRQRRGKPQTAPSGAITGPGMIRRPPPQPKGATMSTDEAAAITRVGKCPRCREPMELILPTTEADPLVGVAICRPCKVLCEIRWVTTPAEGSNHDRA